MVLSLLNVDPGPNNTNEVAATGAVRVWIGGAVVSGVVASYTYRPATHDVLINTMTLGTQTGALQFGVTVTAPSNAATLEVLSSGHTVVAVPLFSGISTASLKSLIVNTSATGQTVTLTGTKPGISMSNIAVFLNTSSTQVTNCTVTSYDTASGLVTFTATPSVTGINTLYVTVKSTTKAYMGATGQGYFVDWTDVRFRLPTGHNNTMGVINSDGSWTSAAAKGCVIVNRVFAGDFDIIISLECPSSEEYAQRSAHHVAGKNTSAVGASVDDFTNNTGGNWVSESLV